MSKKKLAVIIVVCIIAIIVAIVLFSIKPWERTPSAETYILTTIVNPSGAGSVSPSSGEYESGDQVTLTASPDSGCIFDYWSGNASGTTSTITINMDSDKSVIAHFKVEFAITELSISQVVEQLAYSEETGNALTQMGDNWLDEQGKPVYNVWEDELTNAREAFDQGTISEQELIEIEITIIEEVSQRIIGEVSYKGVSHTDRTFDLAEIIEEGEANCLGYSQLFYILGNSLGLPVKAISEEAPGVESHVACLACLANENVVMADIPNVSQQFELEETFAKVGHYWELRDESNPLGLRCTRFRILEKDGIIALRYYSQGNDVYLKLGQYDEAISELDRAVELDPTCAGGYQARGVAYADLGEYDKAISDYTVAIELDPKFAMAYQARGLAYGDLGEYDKAISDCTVAIELDPEYAGAYVTRGGAYIGLDKYDEALSDSNKAIQIDPECADAYLNRGVAYMLLEDLDRAIADFTNVIELDPECAKAYFGRGVVYAMLEDWDEAIADLNKAKVLDPALTESVDYWIELIEEEKG